MPDIDIDKLQIEVSASSEDAAKQVENLSAALKNLKSSMRGIKNPIPKDLGQETSDLQTSNAEANVKSLASELRNAANSAKELFTSIRSGLRGISTYGITATKTLGSVFAFPLKGFTNNIKNAITSVRKFTSSIGRILMYRAIRTLLKEVTQSIKDGIDNLSAYSRLIDTEFHKSLDGIASDALYIKNSLASVAAPIINFVKPAFDALADSIANALNMLAEFMARMTGAASYSKAIKFNTEYGDSIQKAGEKAKQAKKNLLGIDELNIFQEPTSGTGGGFSADDYSKMFEEVKLDTEKFSVAEQIRAAIEKDDWRGAGETLAEKLNESIASFNSYDLGKTIGEKINNAIESVYGFLNTFNFRKLGGQISGFINGALSEINFDTVGRIFTRKFTALFDLITGFIQTLDWKLVGKSIGDFLRGAFDEAPEWIQSYNWKEMAENLWDRFKSFIEGGNVTSLAKSFFNFVSNAITALADFINGVDWADIVDTLFTTLSNFIRGADIKNLLTSMAYLVVSVVAQIPILLTEAIAGIVGAVSGIFEGLGIDSIAGFFSGLSNGIKDVVKRLKNEIIDPFVNSVKNLLGIHSPSTVFAEIGGQIVEGLLKGLKDAWGDLTSWLSNALSNLKQSASNVFQNIKSAASTAWDNLKTNVSIPTPAFATGGFPEDGLFYANHGELVGQFSNGRTAVANNEQIVEGISEGVRDANTAVVTAIVSGVSQIINAMNENAQNGSGLTLDGLASALWNPMQHQNSVHGSSLVAYSR